MSLKAKLEAVIYAAEEPVTLSQLAALFAADALEWKAEQEAATAEAKAEADAELPLSGEEFQQSEIAEQDVLPEQASLSSLNQDPSPEAATSESEEQQVDGAVLTLTAGSAAEEESELKRQAKQRDREVRTIIRGLLDQIIASYAADDRGVEVREIAGGFRMATKPECHDAVRMFVKSLKPAMKLSLAALETLAVIAYKQPVTSPEVSEIRGVESAGVLGSLLARKLIATAGRKQVIGRPILYKTTKEFLLRFGLKDVAELPSMEEFEKMAAIELEEPEPDADDVNELTAQDASALNPDSNQITNQVQGSNDGGQQPPMQETDPGAVPESADTPAEQESPVAVLPAPTPAVMAALNQSETPAETAAEPSDAPEVPALAHTLADEPQLSPEDEPAALEPANDAD
jgi:segregation and condensation protein B